MLIQPDNSATLTSAVGVSLLTIATGVMPPTAIAQLTPAADGTNTQVTQTGDTFNIERGSYSGDGTNQFHSFDQFGLEAGQAANFIAAPETLNILSRVTGGDASVINGLLQVTGANANLYLVNPAGILFGAEARLNVPASFAATTATRLGLATGWFDAIQTNNYAELVGNPTAFTFDHLTPGAILNAGDLTVAAGNTLSLTGGTVVNTGTLTAPGGGIALTAVPGESRLRLSQTGMVLSLDLDVNPADGNPAALTTLTPESLPDLLTGIEPAIATGATVNANGSITLTDTTAQLPTTTGVALVSGQVEVAATENSGGAVQILGDRVGVVNATINATGAHGGGTIHIGGEFQGGGDTPTAQRTWVDADSAITADAIAAGNGGELIIWSDGTTGFYGSASAQGGATGGNGGFVEISGAEHLAFAGQVDLAAPNGAIGELLLDPRNILIVAGASAADDAELIDGAILRDDRDGEDLTISAAALEAIVGDITLQADDDIQIETGLSLNFATTGNPDNPGGLIRFSANDDFAAPGSIIMDPTQSIQTNGRDLSLDGDTVLPGSLYTAGGDISIFAPILLAGDTVFDTGAGLGGRIDLGTVNTEPGAGVPANLTLIAGLGRVFTADLGVTNALETIEINGTDLLLTFDSLIANDRIQITSQGDLSLGDAFGTIELNADNIQLAAIAGDITITGDTQLTATQSIAAIADRTVYIYDTASTAIGLNSGNEIRLQGNEFVRLEIAQNPASVIDAGNQIRLISDGVTTFSGSLLAGAGGLAVENLAGTPGIVANDSANTLITSTGDVSFGNYLGRALKVEALGSITAGDIIITEPNIALASSDPDISILNQEPALILRAGLTSLANVPNLPIGQINGAEFSESFPITNPANLTVGNISTAALDTPGGRVILTAPGTIFAGDIDTSSQNAAGGSVTVESPETITIGNINTRTNSPDFDFGLDEFTLGGAVSIRSNAVVNTADIETAGGQVQIEGSAIATGDITAYAANGVNVENSNEAGLNQGSVELTATAGDIVVRTIDAGVGGINITAAQRFQATGVLGSFRPDGTGALAIEPTIPLRNSSDVIDFLVSQGFDRNTLEQSDVSVVVVRDPADPILVSVLANSGSSTNSQIVIRHGGEGVNTFAEASTGIGDANLQIIGGTEAYQFVSGPFAESSEFEFGDLVDTGFIDFEARDELGPFDFADPTATLVLKRTSTYRALNIPAEFPASESGTVGAIIIGNGRDNVQFYTSLYDRPFIPGVDPEPGEPMNPMNPVNPVDPNTGNGGTPTGGNGGTPTGGSSGTNGGVGVATGGNAAPTTGGNNADGGAVASGAPTTDGGSIAAGDPDANSGDTSGDTQVAAADTAVIQQDNADNNRPPEDCPAEDSETEVADNLLEIDDSITVAMRASSGAGGDADPCGSSASEAE